MPGSLMRVTARSAPRRRPRTAVGTSVEVRDLFFNVPARRKFLRTENTEYQHIVRMLERLALSRFDVAFALIHNGKNVWTLNRGARATSSSWSGWRGFAARNSRRTSSNCAMKPNLCGSTGWLALPTFSRSQADLQFAYVNGRFVRDKLWWARRAWPIAMCLFHGRFCAYVLYLDLDPSQVDVNAHPQKLEVRFRDSRRMHDFVFRTLEKVLADTRPSAESAGSAPADWLTGRIRLCRRRRPCPRRIFPCRRRRGAQRPTPTGRI